MRRNLIPFKGGIHVMESNKKQTTSTLFLRNTLLDVLERAFPSADIGTEKGTHFFLEIHPKESATKHGVYYSDSHLIRLFNLSRPYRHIFITTLHELTHHLENILHGITDHKQRFYTYFHQFLITAMGMGLLEKNDLLTLQDTADLKRLQKQFGNVYSWKIDVIPYKENRLMARIANGYEWRDLLRTFGYSYLALEQIWQREIVADNQLTELAALKAIGIPHDQIVFIACKHVEQDFYYYLVIRNAFEHKEVLKKLGYGYGAYGKGDRNWVKKIKAKHLLVEKEKVSHLLGVHVKVQT